ncbi:MAG TPA: hypothetical protein VMF08_17085 [Candidatus Sulfotelmatobacter sp.]|nr:hypothetical protein [Candidatus Sulfotelmatobacter sp.]
MNPNLEMLKLLDHFFQALDGFIDDYGVYLYLVFVWLALAVIAWMFSGGLRRKLPHRNSTTVIPGIIFTMQPPIQSPPPIIITDADPARNDDNETMD